MPVFRLQRFKIKRCRSVIVGNIRVISKISGRFRNHLRERKARLPEGARHRYDGNRFYRSFFKKWIARCGRFEQVEG